ncbi:uncharacterized protein [Haliotis asinina]|uniref:uncharacterized protein n=1 Tax=Haliotis asinina TaxID=109174 RepID=UPI003531C733
MAAFLSIFRRTLDQDMVDNVNGFWSVLLLALCSIGAFLVRYLADPINCWHPKEYTPSHSSYADQVCFLTDRYYGNIPFINPQKREPVPSYHLWIPLILFFQALGFKVPNIIWNGCKHLLSLNLDETVSSMNNAQVTNAENRQVIFTDAARVIGSLLRKNRCLLALLYLFVKLLSCVNLIAQFLFLTIYFRQHLAIRVASSAGFNMDSIVKPLLAKHVMCNFGVRKMSNVHEYLVQCTLPITEIYEKMFTFLWYWVFLLALITILNLVLWAGFLFVPFLRDGRIAAHVNATKGSRPDEHSVTRFTNSFLGIDGVLVLSMISQNSSELVSANLTQHLYQVFQEKEEEFHAQREIHTGQPEGGAVEPEAEATELNFPMSDQPPGTENSEKPPIATMAAFLSIFRRTLDQDMVDNANGFWSVLLLALCSIGAFLVRYLTDPIRCWYPVQWTSSHSSYADQVCFRKDRFYELITSRIPQHREAVPSYHLWIPLILALQAFAFKVPNIIWNGCKHLLSLNLDETVSSMNNAQVTNAENRQVIFTDAARVIGSLLRKNRCLLALLYLFVKLLSCVNLIAQFLFLTIYFRQHLAIRVASSAGFNMDSIVKPLLLNHVLCDVTVRVITNVHIFSVQCTLPITEIYEKMFTFLWYWVFLLALITILNLVLWAGFLFLPFFRDGRIAAHVNATKGSRPDEHSVTRFISSFLGIDGVLVLSMISQNSSELVSANLTQHLYQVFQEKEEEFHAQREIHTGQPEGGAVEPEAKATEVYLPLSDQPENPEKPPIV